MAVKERVARSFSEFSNVISSISDEWEGPWFRGQDRASYSLTPRRYRFRVVEEDEIRSEFKRCAVQLLPGAQPVSEWDRYFIMQHYGLPTRLLDWSEGGLLALHFALISNKGRADAAVWVLDPFWLNSEVLPLREILPAPDDERDREILSRYLREPFPAKRMRLPELPIALQPTQIDRRIAAQLSCFTVHGCDPSGLETVAQRAKRARLIKIKIPRASIARMLDQLLDAGITERTVYPDLFGLNLELTRLFAKRPLTRS